MPRRNVWIMTWVPTPNNLKIEGLYRKLKDALLSAKEFVVTQGEEWCFEHNLRVANLQFRGFEACGGSIVHPIIGQSYTEQINDALQYC